MSEVAPAGGTQLDRIEGQLGQIQRLNAEILDRLTRMEERQNSLSSRQESHAVQIEEARQRLHQLELEHAVAKEAAKASEASLQSRWTVTGKIALVLFGSGLTFLSGIAVRIWGP